MKNEVKHTAHSSYRCEYHLVFTNKNAGFDVKMSKDKWLALVYYFLYYISFSK